MVCRDNPRSFALCFKLKRTELVKNLHYIVAVALIFIWAIAYFGYDAKGLIHMLLFTAIVALVYGLIQDKKVV